MSLNRDGDAFCDVYPVGLFRDVWQAWIFREPHRIRYGLRYLRTQAAARNWRACRNYFNGYLAEHDGCPHNAGKGWTKRAARRRVERMCAETIEAELRRET